LRTGLRNKGIGHTGKLTAALFVVAMVVAALTFGGAALVQV
jgi:hypothetical protein